MSTRSCAERGMILMKNQTTDSVMTAVNKDLLSGRFDLYDSMAYFVIDGVLRDKFHYRRSAKIRHPPKSFLKRPFIFQAAR